MNDAVSAIRASPFLIKLNVSSKRLDLISPSPQELLGDHQEKQRTRLSEIATVGEAALTWAAVLISDIDAGHHHP